MNLYTETIVNTYRAYDQQNPDTAVLIDGSYVTTWQSNNQDGSVWGIYAQRFSALGVPMGVEFRVNAAVGSNQITPKAAATSDGGFVITWSDDSGLDGSGYGVFAQRYSGAGAAQGSNFLVNTTTSSTQYNNAVVGYTGGFATVWASYNNAGVGNSYDIYVQRWDNAGNKVGAETLISKTPASAVAQPGDQVVPDVAVAANGDMVFVWQDQSSQDGSSYGVFGRRYTAATGLYSDTFLVNTTTSDAQYEPSVAMLAGGGFVAVWRSDNQDGSSAGVYGQRFDAAGAKLGGEFLVNQTTTGGQYQPNVLALSTGGFVISFYNDYYDVSNTGTTSDVYVREYSAAGVPLTNQIKLASSTGPYESQPVLADLGNGNYVVTYTDYDGAVGTNNIAQQIFGPTAGGLPRQADPVLGNFVGSVTYNENLVNATPQLIQPVVALSDADSANFAGGQLDLFYVQYGGPEDQLSVRSVGTGSNQISVSGSTVRYEGAVIGTISGGANGANLVITFTAAATVDAVEQLVQSLTYGNTSQSPAATRSIGLRISDGDGGATVGSTMTINVTPDIDGVPALYGETVVNSYTPNDQQQPNVATLADGSYVIVWQSYDQDNSLTVNNTWGVYAQRYTPQGTAIGAEVRVNTYTGNQQGGAHVAALSNGGYVVTFDDAAGVDGSGQGVIGQVYSAAGAAQGANFVVNTNVSGTQQYSDVAGYAGGGAVAAGFAAVWSDANNPGGNGWDIYLQRYTNAGVKVGGEVLVSAVPGAPGTPQAGTQIVPRVAAYANGDLVIVWRDDNGADGGATYGVFGRKYTAATNTFGEAFVVNTNVVGNQYEPDVATLADGGFVVVWRDDNYDGSSAAVVGQRFNAAGAKVGADFLVNESTIGGQYQPSVTGLSTGGFVVSFYNDNYDITGGGTSSDVYIRQYDAAGNAIDGQRKLISPSNSGESQPSIADLGGGNFVVAYTDYNNAAGGSNSNDIVQQIFGTPAALPRQADPVLGDFTGSVTFAENAANATPQVIDASVSVGDADSANFAGGALDLYTVRGGEATDQFGVRNQGTGAGQIGVSGASISFGGAAIGTLSGGVNGANLHIDFLVGATPAAVQALVQNLTYASTSQDPQPTRTVGLRISDGDGGSTPASTFTINVTPELDGQPVVYGEERVNTYTAAEQTGSQVAVLADGSYVVVWNSNGQDGDYYGVYGQRYTAKGVALGVEFRLNTVTAGEQSYPHVAGLVGPGGGGFVTTWQDNSGSDGSGWGVYGQRYDAGGAKVGSQFLVNSGASDNSQFHDVVVSYNGGYAVAWASNANVSGNNGFDIYIKRYDNSGAVVTAETRVSTNPGSGTPGTAQDGTQYLPDVSAAANGDLVIVWRDDNSNDGSSYGVYGRLYNAAAGTFSDTFLVNTSTGGAQYEPSVATLADGSFVVVWRNDNFDGSSAAVVGQHFSAAGVKLGGEFLVNESVNGGQYQPQITALSTGGFVVAFYNDNYDLTGTGTYNDVYIREYDASANPIDGQRKLVSPGNYYDEQSGPAIADLGGGNFVVTYTDYASAAEGGNNTYDIKQQIFGNAAVLARQANPELGDFAGSVTYLENVVNATPQLIDAAVSLTDIDSPDFNGGKLDLYFVQGGGTADQLGVRNVGAGAGQIGLSGANVTYGGVVIGTLTGGVNGANLQVSLNVNATVTAVQTLIQNLTYANTANSPEPVRTVAIRVSDGDGGASNAGTVTINVTPQVDGAPLAYGESRVNTYTPSQQNDPEVTTLADGSYVVVWTSDGQDGSFDGVYGQRFAANGLALGNEFHVSTASTNYQQYPHAAALSTGGFVVVWQDNNATDGASWGVIAQRYDATGAAVGSNFTINSTTVNDQYHGVVAGYTSGFAVVWSANQQAGGSSNDIYIRRFDNNGVEVTPETLVSTVPGQPGNAQLGNQYVPDVAAYANGDLVIVWRDDNGNDGSSYGVYGRTYNAAAGTFGDTFLVNTSTTGNQYEPSVATLATGGFVVVWRNDSYDGSSAAVVGQRFDAAGAKVGSEFQVNETTNGGQYQPAVTGLSTGGFVVTFYNDNYDATGTGTYSDIYIRQYDAAGNAVDSQRKLAAPGNYYDEQSNPAIADLGNGSFVVTYQGYASSAAGGNNTLEIQQQIFGSGASLLRTSANPVLGDLRAQVVYTNAAGPLYAGTAQLIDSDVSVTDADSADFAGGTLTVNFLTPTTGSEALGIRNQGTGAGQIGVAGATVSYGGVAIGSIQAVGSNLQVLFNSAATPAAARALVENLTYQNSAPPSGTTNRSISVRLTDGDGGVTDASTLQITIQDSYTPPTLLLSDVTPAVTVTETLAKVGVVLDDAVQLEANGAGFANGHFTVTYNSGTNRVDDQLSIRNQGTGAGQVSVVGTDVRYEGVSIGTLSATDTGVNGKNLDITFKAAATAQAIESVIENLVYATTSAGPLASRSVNLNVTDGAGNGGTARTVTINVTPETDPGAAVKLFGEQQVNTYEYGQQLEPAVGRLQGSNNGGYVISWTSQDGQDGSVYGVFAQRYDAHGGAVGGEFRVNTQTLNYQNQPAVAGLASGGYVIAWTDNVQDGSSNGVYAQRYAADGTAQGGAFRAAVTTLSNQYEPAVVGLADGSFVVAYRSDYSNSAATYTYDVLAQRYAADGTALGAEITLNSAGGATQFQPKLTALAGGGYVAVFTDTSGDASGYGIEAQIFTNAGAKVGALIAVNTSVVGTQQGPDITALAGGGFVATWWDNGTVYAQIFNATGASVGGQITVNTVDSPANQTGMARVAGLESGGFVVAWDGYPSASLAGSSQDVMIQQFDATGNRVDGVQVVNTTTASTQYLPDIEGLTGSNFVVTWAGYSQERGSANSYGVFQQLMGTAGSITQSAAPLLVDLVSTVTYDENVVNATPQIIDAGVGLTDSDSANFNGGLLTVTVIAGYGNVESAQLATQPAAQDVFAIRNQGNGATQVGVSGSSVSYGGVVVGSIVANGTLGHDLVVSFNANATAPAVEAIIENLTYANTASAPVASRTVSVTVSDGSGGASIPRQVVINVTPQADGGVALYGNEQVNTYAPATQSAPDSAKLSDGGYITVWASDGQDGWAQGVYAQHFDAKGVPLGAEFRINSYTPAGQYEPTVTGLSGGGYVVAWRSDGQDGSGTGVYAQRYTNDGNALGAEFRVNTTTSQNQYQPNVTATADGGFVVAWYHDYYDPAFVEYRDVFFQRYNAAGVAQGVETQMNPTGEGTVGQSQPNLIGLSGGGFVGFWSDDSKDGSSTGVYAQRFDAAGAKQGASFKVNSYTPSDQSQPEAAALNDGGFIVTWTSNGQDGSSYGVFAQRYSSAGAAVGSEFRVNTDPSGNQSSPHVAALSHGGWAISWYSDGQTYVQQFDASGVPLDGQLRVDTYDNNNNSGSSSVVGLANGGFVVTWQDYDYANGTEYNIYQQLFGNAANFTRQANPQLVDVASSVTFLENAVNAAPQIIDGVVGLSDADSPDFAGGALEVNYLTGYALQDQLGLQGLSLQDQLGVRNQGTGAGQIGVAGNVVSYGGVSIGTITSSGADGGKLAISFNANASVVAVERLIENLTYANTFSDPSASRTVSIRVTDGDGGASVARSVVINVTPQPDGAQALYSNETVNTYTANTQASPESAALSDGSYITVWSSTGQDGWAQGVYGQHYDAKGVAIGTEFQINTYTPYDQYNPVVTGLKGGGYVVAWRSDNQDGSGAGTFAQRYANDGTPLGAEFRVNTTTSSSQYQASISGTADGGFVVAWYHDYYNASFTEYRDIYFQRYNAVGVPQGTETQANPTGEGTVGQSQPSVLGLAGGSFVILWTDDSKDGSSYGIYAQRYAASGAAQGSSFRINTYTPSDQSDAHMAALNDGGFVVVWTSNGQDLNSYGVYGQRYDAAGAAVGAEFRVNNATGGNQSSPAVAALSTGGFAVSWYSDAQTYVQQFDASGARVDGQLRVDTYDNNNASGASTVVGLAGGGFVVSWQDYDYANGTDYNIYQQLFGAPADFVRQANPQLVEVASSVTFRENTINEVPQLIDGAVGLIDTDSPNFDGGVLEVNYLTGYGSQDQLGQQGLRAQDQLGIRSQGTAAHQVSVVGNTVSYAGVTIGTITSNGANGNKLAVTFNANATVDAVEHVIESLTYANTVSNPIASRTISIRVTDGDGGASTPQNVVINVTPENDGAVPFGVEKVVNTSRGGDQVVPSVARLSDGGYIVVWQDQSGADGSSYGVYGQRYDGNDNAVGSEFRVNTTTSSAQYEAKVVGLNGGGFVATWRSDGQDGSGAGVYGQVYQADGTVLGGEIQVNTTTSSNQYQNKIIASADGGFIVAWYHDANTPAVSDYYDIYFQRFDASGARLGGETRATPPIAGNPFATQSEPGLAWLNDADGGFVVTWTDGTRDGDSNGVFAQRYTASGVAEGSVLAVNAYISSNQHNSSVAGLKDGGFVVTWESEGQDLSSTGIYAQRFDAVGAKVGTEFRVNTNISGQQYQPTIAALENGGWAISWTNTDTTSGDVYVQQYNALGQQVDGETRVNTYTPYVQSTPSITSLGDGGFVVAYSGYIYSSDQTGDGIPDGGNDTFEIRLQRFSNTAPTVSNVSVTGLEEAVIQLKNSLFEGGFVDPEGQSLQAIRIVTLPAQGLLKLGGVAVTAGLEISLAQLQAGLLTYQGNVDYFGPDQFRWNGSDGIAFATTPVFTNILLSNVNDGPRLGLLTDTAGSEGSTFSRSLVIGDPDPEGHQITVAWGDGSANTVFTTSSATPTIQHVYADNGSYAVTVTVDDQQGQPNSVETGTFNALIANVAPTIALFGDSSTTQGTTYTLTLGSPFDPGTDTVNQYTIDWGDGSPVQVYTPATLPVGGVLTHIYTGTGTDTITVALRDEDGTFSNAGSKQVTIQAPAEVITVNAGADVVALEGTFFSHTITFTDATDQGPAGRTYSVTWGDGGTSSGFIPAGVFAFDIGHAYADNGGPYNVLVTVDDSGTVVQQGSDAFLVTVNNVAPTVGISGAGSVNEASPYTITVNPFDPGTDTISQYVVRWGDGNTETYTPATLPANRQLTHTYADGNASFTINVDVTDEDGTYTPAGTATVFVANVAPVAPVTGPSTIAEGSLYTLNVGVVTDPGPDTRTGYSIDWGDGSPTDNYTPAQWAIVQAAGGNFTHTFLDGGLGGTSRTINVIASDEDGTFTLGSKLLTVANVAPTVVLTGAANTNEAATYTLNIGASDPAGAADPLGYSVDWGDGSAVQTYTAAQLAAVSGNLTHVYADDADGPVNSTPFTIVVTVDDGDGGITAQNKVVNVNNVAPTAPVSGAASVGEGGTYVLTVGAITDPGPDTRTGYSIAWGDGSTSSYTVAQWATAAGSFNHVYADGPLAASIVVSATDEDGTFALGSKAITVGNLPPTLGLSGNANTNEGASYSLGIVGSDPAGAADPLTYTINWGDGSAVQTVTAAQLLVLGGTVAHVYADDEDGPVNSTPRTISVTADDGDGGLTTQTRSVSVDNVAPTAAVSGPASVNEGSVYTLTVGAVADPGADTRTGYTINWGDGNTSSYTPTQWAAAAGSYTHTYADGNASSTPTIVVSATDEDGTFTLGSKAITVVNVAPTLSLSGNANTFEGASYSLGILGSDAAGAADPLVYRIDWNDGSAVQTVTAAQLATLGGSVAHIYADDEDGPVNSTPRTISVTVDDGDGGLTTRTLALLVDNVAPTAPVSGPASVNEGSVYTLTVGAVVDPGTDTRTGYSINWGDGNTSSYTPTQWAAAAGSYTHTYADGNASSTPTIVVSATDEDGTFTLGSRALTVVNVAPTLTLGGNANTLEGASYSLSVAATDPAGAADPLSYSVDWGDGSAVEFFTGAQLLAFGGVVQHTYADDQDGPVNSTPRTVTVTANDGDGGITTQTKTVTVDNVAPTAAVGGAASVNEGSLYTLTVGAVADPGADTRTGYTINWGDGNTSSYTPTQWAAAAGSYTHTYADGLLTPTIVVSTTDEDGTFTLGSKAITVNNVAPTLALSGNANTNEGASFSLGIVGSDVAGAADPLVYRIDWNDGSAVQTVTAAQLAVLGGSVAHVYADDEDGPVNSTPRTISVTADDGDGGLTTLTRTVNVDNVAPTLSLGGGSGAQVNQTYTLILGAVADPGTDTVSSYLVNWGDGSAVQTLTAAQVATLGGNVPHTYATAGGVTIAVSLVDEDGTFANAGTLGVLVSAAVPTVGIEAGANAALNEGSTFTRSIAFSDGADDGAAGWSYSIDYGDGTVVTGSTLVKNIDLNHVYADGDATRNVVVTVTDVPGESASDGFTVTVNNVAPSAAVGGAASVNEGSVYTLTVGAVADPGQDTRTGYTINWGDGNTSSYTPTQWAAAAGNYTHTYADGLLTPTIVVSTADEDGSFTLGSKSITVNNVAPTLGLSGNANTNEGASYSLGITGSDPAGSADPLTYSIDWNDGSAVQVVTAAQLALAGGAITHVFADDQDGPVNSTPRTISVTANDGDGGVTTQTQTVNVNNVAPTLALAGGATALVAAPYTLVLGAITDPGQDTVSSYRIDWGDGSAVQVLTAAQVATLSGNVPHTYAAAGGVTIAVGLVDEDGTFDNAGTQVVTVSAVTPTVAIEAGPDAALNEGSLFTRSIAFTDGADNGVPGWTYNIDYGDGSTSSGSTLVKNIPLSHVYADGNASYTVTVTVTDDTGATVVDTRKRGPAVVVGESATDSFVVTVNNVAPTAPVSGAATANEGTPYTLSVGAVVDPGQDTRTGYTIAWGDGNTSSYTPTQWATAAGNFAHTYGDGPSGATIVVSATDEDGTFVLGSKTLSVNNVPPLIGLSGNANTNEGATYNLGITGSDPAGAADPLTYTIDWNDGTAAQVVTAAQLALVGGAITHVFADDQDGPVNSTPRTISVTANDGDGGLTTQTQTVNVNNVAPTIALGGTGAATAGAAYTLNLGAINDPGQDTVTGWRVNWGDGTAVQVYGVGGPVTHIYAAAGSAHIAVGLVDEDGTFDNAGGQDVTITGTTYVSVRIGDAPVRQSGANTQWAAAWSHVGISEVHKADYTSTATPWTAVQYNGVSAQLLSGGDIYTGDLGVSGQSALTSSIRQEIDGKEALRFNLDQAAHAVSLNLSNFFVNDDGGVFVEAGRLRLLDSTGNVVGETTFQASSALGTHLVTATGSADFVAVELMAGAYNGSDFVFGAYGDGQGGFGAPITTDSAGKAHGSDYLVDWVEFSFASTAPVVADAPLVGIPEHGIHGLYINHA